MLKQFNIHCNNNNLLPDYQLAYRQNYSMETSIIKLYNNVLWAMENQQFTAFMAIDLSAAFDIVDHGILLNVLTAKFNITGTALKLLDSYLRPRYCKVAVNVITSHPTRNLHSVSHKGHVLDWCSTQHTHLQWLTWYQNISLYMGMLMTMVLGVMQTHSSGRGGNNKSP